MRATVFFLFRFQFLPIKLVRLDKLKGIRFSVKAPEQAGRPV